ncbi:NnrS family protein [Paracidovorax avenae]|uniref:NnrS family protein n=1 Tax=Paracidovorax avenae TaxID=80867 RepID=UPI000D21B04A|nr:NnrS family protein [Paracidovorax avenae]AVS96343.1 NnrS family protein [Paracidovorax avenae]AVT10125.1 NnrS family protein [Paracidovorax avenae]
MATLLTIDEPPRTPSHGASLSALFALGFRPFYLLAAAFAAISVPLWALQFAGWLGRPYLAGPLWHAHEMLFGFALAVIVGFLFTAGRNWTGQPTPAGAGLAALVALWLAARVLVLTPFTTAAAWANIAFPLAAAIALAVPLVRARSRRNYFFVGLLAMMAAAAACIHFAPAGTGALPWRGVQLALDAVLFILCVMGGRVIPMFTQNGVPGTRPRRNARLEQAALGAVLALMAADVAGVEGLPLAALASVAAVLHAWRWWLWQPWSTRRAPLVWVLHAGYAWVPVHLLLRALAATGAVAPTLATHALTVGAIGGLVVGMVTRTARGHTGRPLRADRWEAACYALVLAAAFVRVAGPLAAPAHLLHAVLVSAVLWSAGFGLYALRYGPLLSRPRLDGRPG